MITANSGKVSSFSWWANPDLKAALILVAAGIVFFADPLFSSKNFYYRDIINFHFPLRQVLIDSFARGEFPLWNPAVSLGQPMLANPNYMAFYPTNLLHLLFPFNYAFKLHFILHPIAGGLGFYCLARRLGIGWIAALAGALSYEFSGAVLSFLNLYNIIPAVALIPWAGWAFCGALQGHTVRRSAGFGILLGLQVIAFEPLILQCNILLLAVLALAWIWECENCFRAFGHAACVLSVGALFAAGLTAVQVLPTLELLPLSARGSGLGIEKASEWSVHPVDFLNTIIPNFFGYPFTIDVSNYWGELFHESTTGYMVSFFLGSVTILLSLLSIFSNRTKLRITAVAFLAISILLGLGKFMPVYPWLYRNMPFFNLGRYPSKYYLLSSVIVSILAALGVEAIMSSRADKKLGLTIDRTCTAAAIAGVGVIGIALYWRVNLIQLESMIRSASMPHWLEQRIL